MIRPGIELRFGELRDLGIPDADLTLEWEDLMELGPMGVRTIRITSTFTAVVRIPMERMFSVENVPRAITNECYRLVEQIRSEQRDVCKLPQHEDWYY